MVEMDTQQAWDLLCEFTKSDSLRRHALAVEACVAAYAVRFGEDTLMWSVTALLHDFDYEMHPDAPDHPMKGEPIAAWPAVTSWRKGNTGALWPARTSRRFDGRR